MIHPFSRTELLLGKEALERLRGSRVAVFGVGGVGGYVVEALVRSGVGALELVDNDVVSLTNLNRQLLATVPDIGRSKVEVAKERVHAINPQAEVVTHCCFFLPETADQFDFSRYDYVVDAIDTVSGKIELVLRCQSAGVPIICSMGAGNKLDPTAFQVADIYKTSVDPLARVMRQELRKRGVKHLKCVFATEPPLTPKGDVPPEDAAGGSRRATPGSVAFVPSVAGLILAGEVIKDLSHLCL
jgi:tRNA A37 threonylcarbamoyladenosine dehydratase